MLKIGVELDLVNRRRRLARLQDEVEVLRQVVADSDGFGKALRFQLFHLPPFLLVLFFALAEEGGVDQIASNRSISLSTSTLG